MSESLRPHGLYSPWNSLLQNAGGGRLSRLQVILLTEGSNPGLPHCGRILYQLSHKENPSPFHYREVSGQQTPQGVISLTLRRDFNIKVNFGVLLLMLSHVSRVRLCATPQTAAHQAPVPGILQARILEWVAISFSSARK